MILLLRLQCIQPYKIQWYRWIELLLYLLVRKTISSGIEFSWDGKFKSVTQLKSFINEIQSIRDGFYITTSWNHLHPISSQRWPPSLMKSLPIETSRTSSHQTSTPNLLNWKSIWRYNTTRFLLVMWILSVISLVKNFSSSMIKHLCNAFSMIAC